MSQTQWPEAWARLTTGDTLFRELQGRVQRGGTPSPMDLVNSFLDFIDVHQAYEVTGGMDVQKVPGQWNTLRAMAWCATEASGNESFYRDCGESAPLIFAGADELLAGPTLPEYIAKSEAGAPEERRQLRDPRWAWICIRTLLGVPLRGRAVQVTAAGQAVGEEEEFLVTLEMEVLEQGSGVVAHDPRDAFSTDCDHAFIESMWQAWQAACEELELAGLEVPLVDGRWRVRTQDGEPVRRRLSGSSAGAAAARGWWHALQDKVPDAHLVVLAGVGPTDRSGGRRFGLVPVGGVASKVKAIVRAGGFDTIVVVGPMRDAAAILGRETIKVVEL